MGGVTSKVKVAHFRLGHSRMPFLVAYPREKQEMVFDTHDRAFAFFGGACARGYDNISTAVDTILKGKDRMIHDVFLEEQNALVPCKGAFNDFHETTLAVSKTCPVKFKKLAAKKKMSPLFPVRSNGGRSRYFINP